VLSAQQRQLHNFSFGAAGEARAVQFLRHKGFQILDQNVQLGTHEIDIIAFDCAHNELVFVEVKTRSSSDFGNPSQAVTRAKLRSLSQVVTTYRQQQAYYGDYRFDIIAICNTNDHTVIEHYQNITWNYQI
jgi:putative endonuclease